MFFIGDTNFFQFQHCSCIFGMKYPFCTTKEVFLETNFFIPIISIVLPAKTFRNSINLFHAHPHPSYPSL